MKQQRSALSLLVVGVLVVSGLAVSAGGVGLLVDIDRIADPDRITPQPTIDVDGTETLTDTGNVNHMLGGLPLSATARITNIGEAEQTQAVDNGSTDDQKADDRDTDEGPATIEEVRNSLRDITPDSTGHVPYEDSEPDVDGITVSPSNPGFVWRIRFTDDSLQGSLSIAEYQGPPRTVAETITSSTAVDVGPVQNVIAVANITTGVDADEDDSATVEFVVPRDRFTNASNVTVITETKSLDTQRSRWEVLETNVIVSTDQIVRFEASVESFSLFVIAETEIQPNVDDSITADDGSTQNGVSPVICYLSVLYISLFVGLPVWYETIQESD